MQIQFKNLDNGEVLNEWTLNPSQERFFTSEKKYVLFSGGYGAGKSLMLTLKAIDLALRYPKNYILMGRKTYPELRDSLMKEFFTVCPEFLIKDFFKAETKVLFKNGSEIIFRHLDTVSEAEIRSLNLGAFFIDQAEEVSREVFMGLRGRLRRDGIAENDRRGYLTCNPALTWLFGEFKQNPDPSYDVIECSTLENEKNLPKEYIEDLMKYPESYKKQYVYGIWDADLLSDRIVIAREHQKRLREYAQDPIKVTEGLEVYSEFPAHKGHRIQMGIDPSEGKEHGDDSSLTIVCLDCLSELAHFRGKLPPDILAEKAARFARLYQDGQTFCQIVPEMNSIGLALVNKLKEETDLYIFQREEYDKTVGKRLKKLGWRMTRQSKPLLVSRFQELCRLNDPKVHSRATLEEFKTFVWTDVAQKNGMGAEGGFHDDNLISLFLAFWEQGEVKPGSVKRPEVKLESSKRKEELNFQPRIRIVRGRAMLDGIRPALAGRW